MTTITKNSKNRTLTITSSDTVTDPSRITDDERRAVARHLPEDVYDRAARRLATGDTLAYPARAVLDLDD